PLEPRMRQGASCTPGTTPTHAWLPAAGRWCRWRNPGRHHPLATSTTVAASLGPGPEGERAVRHTAATLRSARFSACGSRRPLGCRRGPGEWRATDRRWASPLDGHARPSYDTRHAEIAGTERADRVA